MDGSTERDWKKHTRDFTEGARSSLTEKDLLTQCEEYQARHGYFGEREFMGITRHPQYINVFWKQKMTMTAGEFPAVLTLVEQHGRYAVIRCFVDLWEPPKC